MNRFNVEDFCAIENGDAERQAYIDGKKSAGRGSSREQNPHSHENLKACWNWGYTYYHDQTSL